MIKKIIEWDRNRKFGHTFGDFLLTLLGAGIIGIMIYEVVGFNITGIILLVPVSILTVLISNREPPYTQEYLNKKWGLTSFDIHSDCEIDLDDYIDETMSYREIIDILEEIQLKYEMSITDLEPDSRHKNYIDECNRTASAALTVAIKTIKEYQQYKAIGTVEECRSAMANQISNE